MYNCQYTGFDALHVLVLSYGKTVSAQVGSPYDNIIISADKVKADHDIDLRRSHARNVAVRLRRYLADTWNGQNRKQFLSGQRLLGTIWNTDEWSVPLSFQTHPLTRDQTTPC